MTKLDLTTVDLFANLDAADLAKLTESLGVHTLAEGDDLFREGDEGDTAFVLTIGEIEVLKESAGREVRLAVLGPGTLVGEMALLAEEPRNATCRAVIDSEFVAIPKDIFNDLLAHSPAAMRGIFDVFIARGRQQESRLRQSERMAQLGVLTAGLAHEMNNPAAAIARGSDQLKERLSAYGEAMQSIASDDALPDPSSQTGPLSSIERSDAEFELETALESAGIDQAWQVAPALIDAGYRAKDLVGPEGLAKPDIVRAVAMRAETVALLSEIREGAGRLADLVGALKSYSFLDQAPHQDVNIAQGIEDTLLILKSKTKGITIERRYGEDVPRITAFGSQLNQVWTNLIDNAADAIHDAEIDDGVITIETSIVGGCVVVEISNNGPEIPPEIQDRIFEAFFTTKAPGKGTGLGLDTAYSIVVNQHRGSLRITSTEDATRFTVVLPTSTETPVE